MGFRAWSLQGSILNSKQTQFHVRFAPDSGGRAHVPDRQLCAISSRIPFPEASNRCSLGFELLIGTCPTVVGLQPLCRRRANAPKATDCLRVLRALSRMRSSCSRIQRDDAMKLSRRAVLRLAAGTAALPIVSLVAVLGQGTIIQTNAMMIVERTQYFAKPGLAAEVLKLTTQGLRRAPFDRPSSRRNIRQTSWR